MPKNKEMKENKMVIFLDLWETLLISNPNSKNINHDRGEIINNIIAYIFRMSSSFSEERKDECGKTRSKEAGMRGVRIRAKRSEDRSRGKTPRI